MKRFLLFLSAVVMSTAIVVGQSHTQYNSLCIYDNTSDASLYTCASVDSITFEHHDGALCQVVWRGGERTVSPVITVDSISFYNPYVEGIVEIGDGIDIWDKAYVTPVGYFTYKSSLPEERGDIDSDSYEILSYANFEDTQSATLILSKTDRLPVWFLVDSLACTFGYLPEDSLCQVSIGCDSAVVCELEFPYNDSIACDSNQYATDALKHCLWIVTSLLDGHTAGCQALTDIVAKFKSLLTVEEEAAEPKLPKKRICRKLKVKIDVYYGVGAWTGGAYDITSSSAVLEGAVYCASAQRDSASVYGIICDEHPDSLTIESASHNVAGYQERLSLRYKVRVPNLKPDTTYYYRAYVRIKKGKNDLQYSYADDKAANAAYGKVRKFTTKEAGLCPDHNHPHMIDLGLPSGTKWACCNVGADVPEGYGGYYAWGETEEKNRYDWDSYKYSIDTDDDGLKDTCQNIGSNISGTSYDVAHVKWGGGWHMPTRDEIKELCEKCSWEWTTVNGVNGQKVIGSNGNSIFLPASGYRGDPLGENGRGGYGNYWSATLDESNSNYVYILYYYSKCCYWDVDYRNCGYTVRPVTDSVTADIPYPPLTSIRVYDPQ